MKTPLNLWLNIEATLSRQTYVEHPRKNKMLNPGKPKLSDCRDCRSYQEDAVPL